MYTNPTFWISIIGAAKLIAQGFGFEIPYEFINDLSNGFAALLTIYGIITNHSS